jgi:cysteine synthase A
MPMQFDNPANTNIHKTTTAQEIIEDFPDGLDYLIAGVGTGGHITGCAEVLKKKFPNLKVFAVEPELSAVLSGGTPAPHPLQGIGAGFIPSILNTKLLDGIIKVNKEDAFNFTRRAAKEEGLFIGISSGASLAAVNQKLNEFPRGSKILTFCYDTGERYLSIEGLF